MPETAGASTPHWYVVPAAGSGSRFGGSLPKQYAMLAGKPLLAWTLAALLETRPEAIVVVVAADDPHCDALSASDLGPQVELHRCGGASRAATVAAGLERLSGRAADDELVLVHDAARPCVAAASIEALLLRATAHADGALLALPVVDTVKRAAADDSIAETVDRSALWLAQTPQAFRFGALRSALATALTAGAEVTDEASAIEYGGGAPALVAGSRANLKVTRPEDLEFAAAWLGAQGARIA